MSEPVVFISHFRIKEGRLEAVGQLNKEVTQRLEAEKPRTLVFLAYMDRERTRISFLHVFADQESMDVHFEGSDERGRAAYELVVPEGWDVYGQPSDAAFETLRQVAAAGGVPLTVQPTYVSGFLRPRGKAPT